MGEEYPRPQYGETELRACEIKKLIAVSLSSLLLCALFIATPHNAFAATSFPFFTSNTSENSATPQIVAVDGGSILYIIWQEDSDIHMVKSVDAGANFTDAVNVSNNSGESTSPQIAVSGNTTIFVVWEEEGDIFLANSTNAGANFTDAVNVSNNSGESTSPQIAVSGNTTIFVVWEEEGDIFLANSTNAGANFTDAVNVSNNSGESTSPQIAVSGNTTIFVVWEEEGDIFLANSTNAGANFTTSNLHVTSEVSSEPDIATLGSVVLTSWLDFDEENSLYSIVYKTGEDGMPFPASATTLVASELEYSSPSIGSSTDNFFVIWEQFDTNDETGGSILVSQGNDDDLSLLCPTQVQADLVDNTANPQLADNGAGDLYSVWEDHSFEESVEKLIFTTEVDPSAPYITQEVSGNNPELWGLNITASGIIGPHDDGDFIQVDWGDELPSTIDSADISACSWISIHEYEQGAVGVREIVSSLIDGDSGNTTEMSEPFNVEVLPHAAELILHAVPSIQVGDNVTLTGVLTDLDFEEFVANATITFSGTGTTFGLNVSAAITDVNGEFLATAVGPDSANTGWTVQAHFDASSAYSGSDSETEVFNTAGINATEFEVPDNGTDVTVSLTDFNATVQFEEVTEGGQLFVEECVSSDTSRFLSLEGGVCLVISPALQMAEDSDALITLSYSEQGIADGFTAEDIDIFFEDTELPSSYLDISQSRNTTKETVTGITSSFGKFILGIAIHEAAPDNALRKQAFIGDDIPIALRDVDYSENVNATISLDKSSYRLTDTATLTIEDKNADLDTTEVDSISALVESETSIPDGITILLTETEDDSGIFTETFNFTSTGSSSGTTLEALSGDELSVRYNQTNGARFNATLHEVIESGVVDVYDEVVDPDLTPFSALGYPVAIKLIDTQLSSSDDETTITLSYGNSDLAGSDENYIRMFQGIDLGGGIIDWIHDPISGIDSDTEFTIGLDNDSKTVTADAELFSSGGIFVLGFDDDSVGGDGGGLGNTDPQEIVVDSIASVNVPPVANAGPDQPVNEGTLVTLTGLGSTDSDGTIASYAWSQTSGPAVSLSSLTAAQPTFTAPSVSAATALVFSLGVTDNDGDTDATPDSITATVNNIRSSSSGGGGGSSSGSSGALPGSTGSTTAELSQSINPDTSSTAEFDIPGSDQNLQIDFAEITSEGGTITVTVTEISQLPIALEGTNATTIGDVYDIEPSSDLIFDGLVYVTLPYDETTILNSNSSENDVRALHFDTTAGWEDNTVSIDTVNNTVTAALSSLSPVLVAIMEDGTYGSAYIEANPLSSISASNPTAFAMQEGQSQDVVVGQPVDIRTTIKNMERNSRSYTYIVQIMDKDGQVVNLDLTNTGILARSQEIKVTSSGWTPTEAGGYTVMIFIWEQNLQSNGIPAPLAPRLVMTDLTVM